jgi:hypothetical protein
MCGCVSHYARNVDCAGLVTCVTQAGGSPGEGHLPLWRYVLPMPAFLFFFRTLQQENVECCVVALLMEWPPGKALKDKDIRTYGSIVIDDDSQEHDVFEENSFVDEVEREDARRLSYTPSPSQTATSVHTTHDTHTHTHDTHTTRNLTEPHRNMGLITALAICVHNFPEGMMTFVSTLSNPSFGTPGSTLSGALAWHSPFSLSPPSPSPSQIQGWSSLWRSPFTTFQRASAWPCPSTMPPAASTLSCAMCVVRRASCVVCRVSCVVHVVSCCELEFLR